MIFYYYYYYYYLRFALFYVARENDSAGLYPLASPQLDGGLRQHFITPCRGLRDHPAILHWSCYATTSECRALCSATSGLAWGMEPCPASSSDRVINTEHINQLSCLHAQSFKILTCVRFDQALYFFGKKLLVKNLLFKTSFVACKFKYPVYLGASFIKLFPLAYDYTCMASFLVRVLRHNMHHVDLSVPQAGLPCSYAYPYVPDCLAKE